MTKSQLSTKSEFEQIVLTKSEQKLLWKLKSVSLSSKTSGMLVLLEYRLAAYDPDGLGDLNRPHYKDTCHITERGRRYLVYCTAERKNFWLKNVWIPIIVAFITTVITNYMLPKLPQILQWVTNSLSKNVS